jgi:hypothetical protein
VLVWPGMTPSGRLQSTEMMMPSELELIDAKLKSFRATSEKEGRAVQWCKDNRDSDPFQMDGKRQAHLMGRTGWLPRRGLVKACRGYRGT